MNLSKVAVLSTSNARKFGYSADGRYDPDLISASDLLLELLKDGFTVYIASTRPKLSPDTYDKCLFDLIPKEHFFTPNPEMDLGHAQADGLIDLWERVLEHFNIPIPESDNPKWRSWVELRWAAQKAGIVTGEGDLRW